jgi:microcystin-dependent protein
VDAVELLFRIAKGEPLTDLELDDNFRKLKTAINFLLEESETPIPTAIRGEIKLFSGASLPTGHLWCNGAAVSRTTYASLFAITGTKFGVGNGTTTFNLPDFRGASPMGSNPMGLSTKVGISARTDGAIVGAEIANADHDHTASGTLNMDGLNYTPTGIVAVTNYTGNATPSITTTIAPVVLSTTPIGTVAVDNYSGSVTPTITVASVVLSTTPTGSIESTTTLTATAVSIDVDGETCVSVSIAEATESVMDCVELTISTDNIIAAIDATTTSVFTGDADDLAHNHTATSSAVSLNHGHTATFTGTSDDLAHSHTATSTSSAISLNHGHSATFTGANVSLTPEGTAEITVDTETLAVSTIQPSQVCNFIIKY